MPVVAMSSVVMVSTARAHRMQRRISTDAIGLELSMLCLWLREADEFEDESVSEEEEEEEEA